jgi:hypothetical protein
MRGCGFRTDLSAITELELDCRIPKFADIMVPLWRLQFECVTESAELGLRENVHPVFLSHQGAILMTRRVNRGGFCGSPS